MKSEDVRRSVRSAHAGRDAGDAPNMGKVSKIPGTGLPKEKHRKRISESTGRNHRVRRNRKKVIAAWTLLIGSLTAFCLTLAIWQGLKNKSNARVSDSSLKTRAAKDVPVKPRISSLSEKEQIRLLKEGLAVRDPVRIPDYFREGDLSPEEEVAFLAGIGAVDGKLDHCEWLGSINANGLSIDRMLVYFNREGKRRNRIAEFVPDSAGKWKIDFDAFARTSTPSWESPVAGNSRPAKVRAFLTKDNYFNGPFKDEAEWLCVGFASPDFDKTFTGYCKTGSQQAAALNSILSRDGRLNRIVIEIKHLDAAEPRQFIISRVIAEDWVIGDMIFDDRFK